ncbi:MAG TPA: AAA family ATPase [Cyclobacteriaceae bacterium]
MFKKLENNRPFLKMAFEGFAGDGKTYTAAEVAIGVHKLIGSKKPIALYDTEKAFKALTWKFEEAGIEVMHEEDERSLESLFQAIAWCEAGNADILVIDSITHVWEEFLRAYLNRPDKHGKEIKRNRLEFQDWGVLKPTWKEKFSTPFVMAKVHIIFTGRAGYEYTDERNEDTGKREIFKSGIKMKAETETAFEPDILVLMQKVQNLLTEEKSVHREATVVKDRTTKIDGKIFKNPTFDDFYPAVKVLLDGSLRETCGSQIPDTFAEFENKYSEIGKERDASLAEIEGCFELMGLGNASKDDKQFRAWILSQVYGLNSLEMIAKKKNVSTIKEGLKTISAFAAEYKDYLNIVLDSGDKVDGNKLKEMMKRLLPEPVKQ